MTKHDISISRVVVFLGLSLAAAACGQDGKNAGKDVVVDNVGNMCVYPASQPNENPFLGDVTPRDYAAGEIANVAVLFDLCLSGSCTTNRVATCTAAQAGNAFTVDATASYHETGASICTTDCALMIARCETPPLAAGSYTFTFAHFGTNLTIPSTAAPPCAGSQR